LDEYEAEDLMESIAEGLKERKFAQAVRLEHGPNPNKSIIRFLMEEVGIGEDDIYVSNSAMFHMAIKDVCELGIPHLRYEAWVPTTPPQFSDEEANIFSIIRGGDVLVTPPV